MEDPALAMLVVQNEDSLLYQPYRNWITPPLALEVLKKRFNEFLMKKYGNAVANGPPPLFCDLIGEVAEQGLH